MSNDVLATLQSLKSHFLLQLSEMPEYRAMKALEKTIAEVTDILSTGQPAPAMDHLLQVSQQVSQQPQPQVQLAQAQPQTLAQSVAPRRAPINDSEPTELRQAEAAIAGVIPARTASPTALRIPTMPMTRRF